MRLAVPLLRLAPLVWAVSSFFSLPLFVVVILDQILGTLPGAVSKRQPLTRLLFGAFAQLAKLDVVRVAAFEKTTSSKNFSASSFFVGSSAPMWTSKRILLTCRF